MQRAEIPVGTGLAEPVLVDPAGLQRLGEEPAALDVVDLLAGVRPGHGRPRRDAHIAGLEAEVRDLDCARVGGRRLFLTAARCDARGGQHDRPERAPQLPCRESHRYLTMKVVSASTPVSEWSLLAR